MKMTKSAVLGVSACAAACAGISLMPVVAGAGIAGLGGLSVALIGGSAGMLFCIALPVVMLGVFGVMTMRSRRAKQAAASCRTDGSCGCKDAG